MSKSLVEALLDCILQSASRREEVLVVCIGNELRGDDRVGLLVAERLESRGLGEVVVNAGMAPENYIGLMALRKPKVLLFVDAVDAGLEPGSVVLGDVEELESEVYFTTHKVPLRLLSKLSLIHI